MYFILVLYLAVQDPFPQVKMEGADPLIPSTTTFHTSHFKPENEEINEKMTTNNAPTSTIQIRATSEFAWQYFTIFENDPSKVQCNACGTTLSRGSDPKKFSVHSLKRHLRSMHENIWAKLENYLQNRIFDYCRPPNTNTSSNKRRFEENPENTYTKVSRDQTKDENIQDIIPEEENEIVEQDSNYFLYNNLNSSSSNIDNLIRLEQLRKAKADADLAAENLKAGKIKNYYDVLAAMNQAKNCGYILKPSDPSYEPFGYDD